MYVYVYVDVYMYVYMCRCMCMDVYLYMYMNMYMYTLSLRLSYVAYFANTLRRSWVLSAVGQPRAARIVKMAGKKVL